MYRTGTSADNSVKQGIVAKASKLTYVIADVVYTASIKYKASTIRGVARVAHNEVRDLYAGKGEGIRDGRTA